MKKNCVLGFAFFVFFSATLLADIEFVRKEINVGGIYTNWWIDAARDIGVKDKKICIGQTFKCPGDILEEVGFGIWRFKSGMAVKKQKSKVVLLLRKGGIDGKVVKKRIFAKGKVPQKEKARLKVHLESSPDVVWYFEVQILNPKLPEGVINFNARRVDCYPEGAMYFNGKQVTGELGLKIIFSKKVETSEHKEITFWSARAEDFVYMRRSRVLDLMAEDDVEMPVCVVCARNEYEIRQFVITANKVRRIKRAVLQVDDLRSGNGNVIGKENIEVEWMRYGLEWPKVGGHSRFFPDPLIPTSVAYYDEIDNEGFVNEPTNMTFWVTFYVPKGTPAGVYRGRIKAIVDNKIRLKRTVELQVLDITLPVRTHTRTALFRGYVNEWVLRDLARYRISSGGMPSNIKLFVKYGRLMNKLGVDVTFVGPWGRDLYDAIGAVSQSGACVSDIETRRRLEALERCKKYYEKFYPILKREGWLEQAYSRLPDEFRSLEMAKRTCEYVRKVRSWAPEMKILTTDMGNNRDVLQSAVGCCDIWCPSVRYCEANLDFYRQRVAAGEKVWPYVHEFTWFYYPAGFLRYYFWALSKNKFDGVCYWTVGPRGRFFRKEFGFVREDNVVPGDGTLYYPVIEIGESVGKRGGMAETKGNNPMLFHSARLGRIRDGIEDMEYIRLMRLAIRDAQSRGKIASGIRREVKEINKFIEDFAYSFDYFTKDADELDAIKMKIAKVIRGL